jgi:signal transduction histidine kinase
VRGHDDDARDDPSDDLEDATEQTTRTAVTLIVARETADIDAALRRAAWTLAVVFSAAGVCMHVVLRRVISRRLRPLEEMARQIRGLEVHSLSGRLPLAGVPTEMQPVAQRFNELLDRVDDAFTRERAFSADVAHELRTPLTGLRAIMDVALSRARSSDQYQRSFADCRAICDQTQRLVETLLVMARLDADADEGPEELVDVALVAGQVWAPFRARAAARDVTVAWTVPAGILLRTDASQFRVLLSNLLDNAVSYVDRGGKIDIRATTDSAGLQMVIANTGCRLPPEQIERAFERFWRADTSRQATGTHSGLGLALCRRIAARLGLSLSAKVCDGRFTATVQAPEMSLEIVADDESDGTGGDDSLQIDATSSAAFGTRPLSVG